MDTTVSLTLTRIGLLCDFLAFFLATPEILGKNGINKLQIVLRFFLWWVGFFLFLISALGVFAFFLLPMLVLALSISEIISTGALFNVVTIKILQLIIAFMLISTIISWIPMRLMKFVDMLANNKLFRRRLLYLGILSFAFGAIAQFIGTF